MGKYQAILLGNSTLKPQVTLALSPVSLLPTAAAQPPEDDCLKQTGLKTQPLAEPDGDLFMNESSFLDQGRGHIQYVMKTLCVFATQPTRSEFPNQGSNTHSLQWKCSLNHWTAREVLWC